MAVDFAIKPSLARYDFREDREFVPALHTAQDSDESLLAMVQQQADIASSYMRSGDPRKAIATLRRVYKVAADHGGADAEGSSVPVARRLAFASIRLQLCAVLSRLGRHDQALLEARTAKRETDEVWRTLLGGCGELAEAAEEGSVNKPAAPLRRLLLRPPPWLQSVVETSVQARQCIAVEIEFVLSAPKSLEASASFQALEATDNPDAEGEDDGSLGGGEEELDMMHREAVMLARQLLPDEHHVRSAAERALLQSELRKQEALERSKGPSSPASSIQSLSPMAANADFLLKSGRTRSVRPAALNASLGESTAQKLLSALDGNMGFLSRRSKFDQDPDGPITHESLFSPPGDVFNRSFKSRSAKSAKEERSLGSSGALTRSESMPLSGTGVKKAVGSGGVREKDPFKAWKREVADVNKMTMKAIKARTFDGIKEMQTDIKRDNRRFRNLWLKEMDSDLLFEDRTFYTPSGMQATGKAERKYEAWRKKAYKPSEASAQKKEEQKKLFAYYGVHTSASEPDLKAWGRVLRESHARTPAERERVRLELEEKRRREEEARRKREEEERAYLQEAAGGLSEKVDKSKNSTRKDTF